MSPTDRGDVESPPLSPASTLSGPYIPISECISGKPLNTALGKYCSHHSPQFTIVVCVFTVHHCFDLLQA